MQLPCMGIPILLKPYCSQLSRSSGFYLGSDPAYSGGEGQSLAEEEKAYTPKELQGFVKFILE